MTVVADALGGSQSTGRVVGREAVGAGEGGSGLVSVRVGLAETGLQVTDDGAELARSEEPGAKRA